MMRGFGTLSRTMLRGFVRDRTALFFTVVFPLMFLVIFGGLLKNAGAPKAKVIEMVRGKSAASVLPELGILLGFAVVVSAIAWRVFRWDDV